MDFKKRSNVTAEHRGFNYTPTQANKRYPVANLTCSVKDGKGGLVLDQPTFDFAPIPLESSYQAPERSRIEDAAKEKGEKKLTFEQVLKEILVALDLKDTGLNKKFNHDLIPKEWLKPVKCFNTLIYVKANYESYEVDIRAKKALEINSTKYIAGEEIGDFIVSFVENITLHVEYTWNKECCEEKPGLTPKAQEIPLDLADLLSEEEFEKKQAQKKE